MLHAISISTPAAHGWLGAGGAVSPLGFMPWNTVLAVAPAVFSLLLLRRNAPSTTRLGSVVFALRVGLIVLFLPNAPYVATDLIHFLDTVRAATVSTRHLLATQVPLYTVYVLIGLASYAFTVDRLLFAFRVRSGQWAYAAGLVLLPLLSAFGIYLGRVARFNSWDIVQQPVIIARSGGHAITNHRTLEVILALAVALAIVHQVYRVFHDGLRYRRARPND